MQKHEESSYQSNGSKHPLTKEEEIKIKNAVEWMSSLEGKKVFRRNLNIAKKTMNKLDEQESENLRKLHEKPYFIGIK